jgi:outer membrane protein TolC
VARADELVESARQGVRLGVLRQEDLLSAEARALEVGYQLAESRTQARSAVHQLKQLMGLEREQALEIKPQQPEYYPPAGADDLVERAMKDNAGLRLAKAEDEYQSLGLELAKAAQGPRFNLIGRYGLEGESFPGPDKYAGAMLQCDISFGDNSAKVFYDLERQYENRTAFYYQDQDLYRKGLRLSFLDGNGTVVQEAEARYQRQKAREELRAARLKLRADLLSLLEELNRQEQMRGLAAKQRDLQGERVSVARGKAAAGAATPAEVLERELDLANAQARLLQADYERDRILATVCLITGDQLKLKDAP